MANRGKYELDYIVGKLSERKQRATYGAVASLVGVPPQSLMRGRGRSHRDSWIVAADTHKPTGYDDVDIDPDCLHHTRLRQRNVIFDAGTLERWLEEAGR